MKVVFDTNALFAAFVSRSGVCASIVEAALIDDDVVTSHYILDELQQHLTGKARLSIELVSSIREYLLSHVQIVTPAEVDPQTCRDSKDLPILGTAVAAACDALVTGDRALRVMDRFATFVSTLR